MNVREEMKYWWVVWYSLLPTIEAVFKSRLTRPPLRLVSISPTPHPRVYIQIVTCCSNLINCSEEAELGFQPSCVFAVNACRTVMQLQQSTSPVMYMYRSCTDHALKSLPPQSITNQCARITWTSPSSQWGNCVILPTQSRSDMSMSIPLHRPLSLQS